MSTSLHDLQHARPKHRASLLSAEEIERLLAELPSRKMQAIVMATYGAELRVSEACRSRTPDADSRRMVIHVRQGKGDRDRHTLLPKRLLERLREYWIEDRGPFVVGER